jgi:hypothetical protein
MGLRKLGIPQNWRAFGIPLFVALISGCSAGNSCTAASAITEISTVETELAAQPVGRSPLDEYLSLVLGLGLSHDEQLSHFTAQNVRQEELTAQCMNNLGFDYAIYAQRNPVLTNDDLTRPLNDPDWLSQWGYGILESPNGAVQIPIIERGTFTENDPNIRIFETLSEGEQEQWLNALWGEVTDVDDYGFVLDEVIGCIDIARESSQEFTPFSIFLTDEFAPLFNSWVEMTWMLHEDISEADRDWASCMADAGFSGLYRQIDAEIGIHNAIVEVLADEDVSVELLDYFREREIETALADFNCRNLVNFAVRRAAHEHVVEAQFVNDHRLALAALRDAAEQRGTTWLND